MPHLPSEPQFADLKALYPGLTEEQYVSLDDWYDRYAALTLRMFDRISGDPEAWARFVALTDAQAESRLRGKVDSPKEHTMET